MQKNIFVVILTFSLLATAPAVANPLNLFIQQCLRYQPSLVELDLNQPVAKQAVQFEQLTLGFNNFNDRLNYYRDLAANSQRESILMCQLHLADELQVLLKDPTLEHFIDNLSQAQPPYSSLAAKLKSIQSRQLDITSKSKLHNAQATIRRNLSNNHVELVFNDKKCQLTSPAFEHSQEDTTRNNDNHDNNNSVNTTAKYNLDVSLAKYLILQPNEQCRKSAWLAYQSRAKYKNAVSLDIIKQIKQPTAAQHLDTHFLDSDALINYLQQITTNINIAPWNIGQHLASLPHEKYTGFTSANDIIAQAFQQLEEVGIRFEILSVAAITQQQDRFEQKREETQLSSEKTINQLAENQIYRVWHQQRLLGELFVTPAMKTSAHIIRYPVIGHQFAQASISYVKKISNRRQANQLIDAVTETIAGLARGNKFYLNNKQGLADNHSLGQLWLAQYLRQHLKLDLSEREQAAIDYRQQLRVFRSKVILDFYLNEHINQQPLAISFEQSFNQEWQGAQELAFSFNGIANEGIDYYLPLWHQSLVRIIFEASKPTVTKRQVFDIFVVNEENLTLNEQMIIILTPPNDPSSIIRRAFNVGHSQI
ncbi:hypothetical protein [Shewanella sp. KT0246]|uniref:hypothetical protein n=1 Tax=Shewanella sp. KT0246 TaxID=2815912 RepID=UPI001BB9E5D2|nr:hypothetical protein [Shewanella sp. KT0246]GIU52865.1 Zn-dependent oligopeptidase [Shewanella sp. KT0246]